jgi:amidase
MTIGVLRQGFASPDLDPAVEKRVRTAIRRVVDRGASVTEVSVPMHSDGTAVWTGIFTEEVVNVLENAGLGYPGRGVYDTEFGRVFTDAVGTSPNDLPKPMKYFLVLGSYVAERDAHRYYAKAQNLRRVLAAAYDDALADVDVLAMPTTLYTAVRVQEDAILDTPNLNANTSPFDATGHPSVSVPCGDVDGLPVGLMLVGKQFDDATVLRAARAVETVTGD